MSRPAQVAATAVVVIAAVLAVGLFIADTFGDDPSSTAVLVFPALAVYAGIAVGAIWLLDRGVRALARRRA